MKNNFNWGWKIAILYSSFVCFMLAMVCKASNQKVELVTTNYYEEELRYQQHIDHAHLADSLHLQPVWSVDRNHVSVLFPGSAHAKVSGTIAFYCPSDEKKDFKYPFTVVADSVITITHANLSQGVYRVNTGWQQNGKELYSESVIKIE
jgi:hypothetical protein